MRAEVFNGREVVATGYGQCVDCARRVIRVLVAESDGRQWHTAEPANYGYKPHHCKSGDAASARKAS